MPGAFTRTGQKPHPFELVRHVLWGSASTQPHCHSRRFQRGLCIFGVRDLPMLTHPENYNLFLNKLYWNIEPLTLDCLEHWLRARVEREVAGGRGTSRELEHIFTKLDGYHMNSSHVPCAPFQ